MRAARMAGWLAVGLLAWGTAAAQTIPAGKQLPVRMIDNLSSETSRAGDVFHGTLEQGITVNGRTVLPKGADVTGQVVAVHRSGRLSDPGELDLVLTSVRTRAGSYPVQAQPFRIKGESHTRNNVTKIGGTAAAGTFLGAIFGGGKGAAIGAGVGAAAGTGAAAATGKKPATVESEAVLVFVTANAMPAQAADASTYRGDGHNDYQDARGSDARRGDWDRGRDSYRRDDRDDDDRGDRDDDDAMRFSDRDRDYIRSCVGDGRAGLPPGLAKRDRLPPGLEKQLQRNGTLPPGLEKRVQPLPGACEARLPRLPGDWRRVILSGRIILLDGGNRIRDMFSLEIGD